MQNIIKALIAEAEVLEEKAKFCAEHVPDKFSIHDLGELRAKSLLFHELAWCKRETALRLERAHG